MKLEELKKLKLINNYVLVEMNSTLNEQIEVSGGKKLWLDASFAKEIHTTLMGIVIRAPKILNGSMPWKTKIEIQKGDTVWMDWDASKAAFDDSSRHFKIDEKYYILVRYQSLFVVRRSVDLSMEQVTHYYDSYGWPDKLIREQKFIFIVLNGFILLDQLKKSELPYHIRPKEYKTDQKIPEQTLSEISKEYCRVGFLGEPLQGYIGADGDMEEELEFYGDSKLKPRDIVKMGAEYFCQPFEYDMHASLDGDRMFFIAQRQHIAAIIE